ncbi:MAG: DinB family protein [Propionibacteriaceae bacterium]
MTWTAPTPPPLVDGPLTGPDRPMLEGFVAWQRHTLLSLCAGLTGEQLAARVIEPSQLSLLGLVRHLAKVERIWLRQRAAGLPIEPLYDPALGKDFDFDVLDPDRAPADFARYDQECRLGDAAVAELPFDHEFRHGDDTYSLRLVYVHLITEYSRHNGHADLLRERLDGTTGL